MTNQRFLNVLQGKENFLNASKTLFLHAWRRIASDAGFS